MALLRPRNSDDRPIQKRAVCRAFGAASDLLISHHRLGEGAADGGGGGGGGGGRGRTRERVVRARIDGIHDALPRLGEEDPRAGPYIC